MSTPTITQQIDAVRKHRKSLEYSFTVLVGPDKGKIMDIYIALDIRALRAAEETLKRLNGKPFLTAS